MGVLVFNFHYCFFVDVVVWDDVVVWFRIFGDLGKVVFVVVQVLVGTM